jgi:hypothetical protein
MHHLLVLVPLPALILIDCLVASMPLRRLTGLISYRKHCTLATFLQLPRGSDLAPDIDLHVLTALGVCYERDIIDLVRPRGSICDMRPFCGVQVSRQRIAHVYVVEKLAAAAAQL